MVNNVSGGSDRTEGLLQLESSFTTGRLSLALLLFILGRSGSKSLKLNNLVLNVFNVTMVRSKAGIAAAASRICLQ